MREAKLTSKVLLMTTPEWIGAIDDWRSRCRPIPSRSEAIRTLVSEALASKSREDRVVPLPAKPA